ncbi:hypothetical protein Vadar_003763 [Vaccinium darrowii]|uniref:Uncharacterized protein n=1 Tax=Vaccinium darrowii TaxID=229202 RepID=A0ACB7YJ15_9ERIC|nr:hypothetical protein Vadar_003763 [Vaccinium darrowii]
MSWEVAENVVPHIKRIREIKEKQHRAIELVKFLCKEVAKSPLSRVQRIFKPVLRRATYVGIPEIVEEILLSYPFAVAFTDQDDVNIFQYAIQCRRERVFNFIYQTNARLQFIASTDSSQNNGLHLAARLQNEQQIILRANAAGPILQLQRELQWFKVSTLHHHACKGNF